MSAVTQSSAEEAVFGRQRGASSWALALTLQVVAVVALLTVARVRGATHTRRLTETMVDFVAAPPRPRQSPPEAPPAPLAPPPPRVRPRVVARVAPPAPAPAARPVANEAPPVLTAPEAPPAVVAQPAPAVQRGPIQLPEAGEPPEPAGTNATPDYPAEARAQGVEATVIATLVIADDGRVLRVIIRRGHALFDEVVRATLTTWRYQPARVAGEAVEVYWNVRVPFRLEER